MATIKGSTELDRERWRHRIDALWNGRFGYRFLLEVTLVAVLLILYRFSRYLARDQVSAAFEHARQVLGFESRFGLDVELSLQRHILDQVWLIKGLNRYYVTVHFLPTLAFFFYAYIRHPDSYIHIRRLFVAVTGIGLILHIIYPLAPPRMMPGFVDTIAEYGPAIYERSDVASTANQFAAMPSLHFGWSVLMAYGILTLATGRWRWFVLAHPLIMVAATVLTANHYWLDLAVAGGLVLIALAILSKFAESDRTAAIMGPISVPERASQPAS